MKVCCSSRERWMFSGDSAGIPVFYSSVCQWHSPRGWFESARTAHSGDERWRKRVRLSPAQVALELILATRVRVIVSDIVAPRSSTSFLKVPCLKPRSPHLRLGLHPAEAEAKVRRTGRPTFVEPERRSTRRSARLHFHRHHLMIQPPQPAIGDRRRRHVRRLRLPQLRV